MINAHQSQDHTTHPQLQPPYSLSLAELEAKENVIKTSTKEILPLAIHDPQRIARLHTIVHDLTTQLKHRDESHTQVLDRLSTEKCANQSLEDERSAVVESLAQLKALKDRELLQERVQSLSNQLDEKCRLVQDTERRFRDAVESGEKRVLELTNRLTLEHEHVDNLTTSVSDVESLRKRCKQLENDLVAERASSSAKRDGSGSPVVEASSSDDSFSKSFVKKKLFELKVARTVITEKDKVLKEFRDQISQASNRAKVAESAHDNVESRVKVLAKELEDAKRERLSAHEEFAMKQILVDEAKEKVQRLELENEKAEKDKAAALVAANESEEKRREYKELLERTAGRCHEALAEKQASIEESQKLRESLAAAEQEIARLADSLQKEGEGFLRATSPCSLAVDSDMNHAAPSQSTDVKSLAELEEAASVAPSGTAPPKLERKQAECPPSQQEATIENLSKSLSASRMYCDEKNEQLQEATATVARHEETIERINIELAGREQRCESLENRVQKELTPALQATNARLEETQNELTFIREEFDLNRKMAEKTRSALELEVGSTTEKLEGTLATLQGTQDELSESQKRAGDLEDRIADLNQKRSELEKEFVELEQENEHRRQSLYVMQERLTTIEACAAAHEQSVADITEEKERLEKLLSQEVDRREVAEKRATRKDGLVLELETRTLELERNHATLKEHLAEKNKRLSDIEEELGRTKEIAQLRDESLQDQANMSRRREDLFESLTGELRMVIQSRDSELRDTKENLSNVEKRVRAVSECLVAERSKLKSSERELADMTRKFSSSDAENQRKDVKLSENEDHYCHLAAQYEAAQEELGAREKQIASHLTSISEKSGKIVGLRAEKTELEKRVRELRDSLNKERSKLESQAAATKKLEDDLTAARRNLAASQEDLSMRDADVDSLSRSLAHAQKELLKVEGVIGDKDGEIATNVNTICTLEKGLERSNHQLAVLESHLDGHDCLLKDNREKEESLAVLSGDLNQAKGVIAQMEKDTDLLHRTVASKEEQNDSLSQKVTTLEVGKANIEDELDRAKKARKSVEKSLNETAASLAALEKSTTEEIADLNATICSLKKVIDEKDSSLNSASETIAQSSIQSQLTKQQLVDSRTRGDRLFSQLTATEYELAFKKETLAALEQRFGEIQEILKGREEELEKLGETLLSREQSLSSARAKLDEMSTQASTITEGELLTLQTKLEAKEKAIANLHNWCCFINGKLHASEKALSERDLDLEVSSTAFKNLEVQLRNQNELRSEKEAQMRKLEASRVVENSELRSRIHALQSYVDEARSELERTKQITSSKGSEAHSSLVVVPKELVECKAHLKSMENEMSELLLWKGNLEETVNTYDRDLAASERTIECLKLDLDRLPSESSRKRDAKDASDKDAAEEILKVRSETGYLIVELRKVEAELSAANETARTWQQKAEELQPLAESTLEAQRAVEIVSSQLTLLQTDSKQRIDLLKTQLKEAERERDAAERDCSAAITDYTAMRARLMETQSRGSAYGRLAAANTLCTATFILEGRDAPSADIMVYLLGEDAALGHWNSSRRLPVRVIGEGDNGIIRKCEVVLPANLSTPYKYAADGPDGRLVWEGDDNRCLDLHGDASFQLTDVWRPPS